MAIEEQRPFDDRYAAAQLARRESGLRARVKQIYLNRILRRVDGPTVDIGCGAGQLLEQLPPGSIGLEVNPALIRDLRSRGLDVLPVTPEPTSISLGTLAPRTVKTAVLSHVLEHFDDAAGVLRQLIVSCRRLEISRLIVVVPGRVGYDSDATHKTFVTLDYLRAHELLEGADFKATHTSYFPGDWRFVGRLFVYHELMVVYDLAGPGEGVRGH